MTIAGALRSVKVGRHAAAERAFYAQPRWQQPGAREAWQLERLNERWREWTAHVPWFRARWRSGALPGRFASLDEFSALTPRMDKRLVRSAGRELLDERRAADAVRTTGGTTSEPTAFPIWREEAEAAAASLWYARGWFGISPRDRLFMIWGHSHLLGGSANRRLRELKDWLLGYRRWSAYQIGENDLREAARSLLEFRPAYVLGYAVALTRFVHVNATRAPELRALGLRAVIATGESFRSADERAMVASVFGAPVVMEYGAVETGPIAHEGPDGRYRAFWRNVHLETVASPDVPGASELLVTTLYPRALPLCRYRLGDLIRGGIRSQGGEVTFDSVVGRSNDVISLEGGKCVHSEAFSHVLRDAAEIAAFQVLQNRSGTVSVRYEAAARLPPEAEAEIRRRLALIDASLGAASLECVERLPLTLAGKTRSIVSECASTESR